jgi:hypothetical protein
MRQPGHGGIHRMLGAVTGADGHLGAQHQRHAGLAAEHVAGLGDLVEDLVRGDQGEVRIHELDHGAVGAFHRDPAGQADEALLGDRAGHDAVGEAGGQAAGRAVGATLQLVDVLADDEVALVLFHPPPHDLGHDIDELDLAHLAAGALQFLEAGTGELGEIAAKAFVAELGFGP